MKLNNYTIDDFIKLKPIIYEYCNNLTKNGFKASWYKNFTTVDDLYQDVFIRVQTKYFNKPRPAMEEGKFKQIMKNCTIWTYCDQFKNKDFKLYKQSSYINDSLEEIYLFECLNYTPPNIFSDLQENPDYRYYTRNLKFSERMAILYFLKGYNKSEVLKIFHLTITDFKNIIIKIQNNYRKELNLDIIPIKSTREDYSRIRNIENLKSVIKNKRHIKLYSLYLQGLEYKHISKELNKPISQIGVEIYRINQKIKKYEQVESI